MTCNAINCEQAAENEFCDAHWGALPLEARAALLAERRAAKKVQHRKLSERWAELVQGGIKYLYDEDIVRTALRQAEPFRLTSEKGLWGQIWDRLTASITTLGDYKVLVTPHAPRAPVVFGHTIYVQDQGALEALMAKEPIE